MLSLGENGQRLITGSVEVHLKCADWWAHGHHADPRYNNVALHVVLWQVGARPITRADGVSVPTLVLADYITMPTGELLRKVSPLVPNLGTLSEEPCWQRTQDWPIERLLKPIEAAGDARLLAKAAAMEADLEVIGSADEVFYRGLMDALGYSANREPMRALADALPISQLLTLPLGRDEAERVTLLEAVLLGAGGLLPSQRPDLGTLDWLSQQYTDEIDALWRAHASALGLSTDKPPVRGWVVDRVRPANAPPRRLAAAARLLARLLWERGGMLAPFLASANTTSSPEEPGKKWTKLLTVPGDGYWATHSDFGRPLSGKGTEEMALVGNSRAADMVVNILLPVLIAQAELEDKPDVYEAVLAVYAKYPKLSENKITRAMAGEALGPDRKKAISTARHQQGLIHLYRLYCEARRCYECPLSGRMKDKL
jgi:hypothetical protein